jgi:hypothetical protein
MPKYPIYIPSKGPPFYLNRRVYSITLVNNKTPYRWRGRYNEDTDLCLQVLSNDWCTISVLYEWQLLTQVIFYIPGLDFHGLLNRGKLKNDQRWDGGYARDKERCAH